MKKAIVMSLLLLGIGSMWAKKPENTGLQEVRNVIFLIGDGMGLNQICTLDSPNNFERAQATGFSKTASYDHKVTDSAARGTAMACGIKTRNRHIGLDKDSLPVPSLLAEMHDRKFATGIVVSCMIDHATPASFYAHQPNRHMSAEIIGDLYRSSLDYFAAGGRKIVSSDSLTDKGFVVCNSLEASANARQGRVAVLLADEALPPASQRGDIMQQAVKDALRFLSNQPQGFGLMVEGSQIDWTCHDNNGDELRAEMADFNEIVGICMDYCDQHPGTLLIVTADHETGATTLIGEDKTPTFASKKHTGVWVPVFAYGTNAGQFAKVQENSSFKEAILRMLAGKKNPGKGKKQ